MGWTMYFHYLIFLAVGSGLTSISRLESRGITNYKVANMCKNPNSTQKPSVQFFCQHVYEKVFKCDTNYRPLRIICDGISHCKNGIDEDPTICSYIACGKNFYKCLEGKCIDLSKLCNGVHDCRNGLDESPKVCEEMKPQQNIFCPIIFKNEHEASCRFKYGNRSNVIPCHGLLPPNTEAEIVCITHSSSEDSSKNHQVLTCQKNGTWDRDIIECRPGPDFEDCGVVMETTITPLILNGQPIKPELWPWYSALFTLIDTKWKFFCSSTIIASNTVITAAHCVWDMPGEYVKVAAGKTFSDFYISESSRQIRDVQDIFIHPLYQDSIGNYRSDIAIIKLKHQFSLTEFVLPICVNWTLRNTFGEKGTAFTAKVAGMGITENGTISDELRSTDVKILNNKDCLRNHRYEFRKYITIATFCAVGKTDGVVCNGDSGSGLAIKNETTGKWFLEGIVSISPKNPNSILCDKKYYSIYTNVGMYSDWIREHVNENLNKP